MTTYLDTIHFDAYVHACAARCGVKVQWDKAGSVPRTDGKTLHLPHITSKDTPDYLTNLRYFVKHETSHVVHTKFDWWNEQGCQGLLHYICNLLEDNRIDYLNDSEFAGDVRLSNEFAGVYLKKLQSLTGAASEDQKLLAPLFAWESEHRAWIGEWTNTGKFSRDMLDITGKERYAKLMAGSYGARLEALRTSDKGSTDDLLSLAKDILTNIYGEDAAKYQQKPGDKKEKGKGKGEGKKEGKGDGEPGEGEGKDGEAEGTDAKDRLTTVDALAKELGADHFKPSRTGIHWKHDVGHGSYSVPAARDYKVFRWPLKGSVPGGGVIGYFNTGRVNSVIDDNAKPLSNKLRIKLQVRSKGRYEYGTKSGKLHTGSLHRLVSARGTEAESRVFRRHVTSDTLDTAVSLLVDCSGSMSGSKFETACASAAALALALKPLHISYNVLGFTNDCERNEDPIVWVFNDWQENVTQSELVKRFGVASSALWNNSDGDAVAWAHNYLAPRKEKRKILIVLSDGSPAGRSWAGAISSYTKKVTSSIEDKKLVELYGIGIMDSNVKMYYKNNVVIQDTNALAPAILSIIDKAL